MATTRINNQAITLYKPGETAFNDRDNKCQWHTDYFNLVTCGDTTEIILDNTTTGTEVQVDGGFDTNVVDSNTSVTVFQLVDSGASFLSTVSVGMEVKDETNDVLAVVLNVISDTRLLLNADIFTSSPCVYSLRFYKLLGFDIGIGTSELNKFDGFAAQMQQDGILTEGVLYKMQIDITSFVSSQNGDQINFKIGGTTVLTIDETDEPSGTITAFGYSDGIAVTEAEIDIDANIEADFDNFVMTEIKSVVFFVLQCDNSSVVYSSVFSDVTTSNKTGQIKLSFDWSNLQDGYDCTGCFFIVVFDNVGLPDELTAERIDDGGFDIGAPIWTFGADWADSGSSATLSSAGGAGNLVQPVLQNDFSSGLSYNLTFTVTSYTDGDLTVKLFDGATEVVNLGTVTSAGTFTFSTGILSANCDTLQFEPGSDSQNYVIDTISAIVDATVSTFTYTTDCFQLLSSHDCTVKLSGTNLDNAFGIDFENLGYNPVVRLLGELETAKYDGDKENEEDSAGVIKTLYFKSEKTRDLFLWQHPEHIHDFIRLLIGYDTFKVDDVDYISTGASYSPEADRLAGKLNDLSNVRTEVRQKTDLNENKFC